MPPRQRDDHVEPGDRGEESGVDPVEHAAVAAGARRVLVLQVAFQRGLEEVPAAPASAIASAEREGLGMLKSRSS